MYVYDLGLLALEKRISYTILVAIASAQQSYEYFLCSSDGGMHVTPASRITPTHWQSQSEFHEPLPFPEPANIALVSQINIALIMTIRISFHQIQ